MSERPAPKLVRVGPSVWRLDRQESSGFWLGMHLVGLPDGSTLIVSPTRLGDHTFDWTAELPAASVILAPNHFHHLGLPPYRERFPEAAVVAAPGAIPRLERQGHHGIASYETVVERLGGHVTITPCEAVKTGEAWIVVHDPDGDTLIVGDAFFNVPGPLRGLWGLMLRATQTGPGLRLGRTFRWVGIADVARYRAWADAFLAELRPKRVSFAHGETLEGPDPGGELRRVLRETLGPGRVAAAGPG